MNRAERRRLDRVVQKVDEPTYYKITLEQLDRLKEEITSETQTHCIKMLFSIPMKVVHEKLGWNQEECQWFAEAICDEYEECLKGGGKIAIDEYTRMTEKLTSVMLIPLFRSDLITSQLRRVSRGQSKHGIEGQASGFLAGKLCRLSQKKIRYLIISRLNYILYQQMNRIIHSEHSGMGNSLLMDSRSGKFSHGCHYQNHMRVRWMKMTNQGALNTMCERCSVHDVCQGTGCTPRAMMQELVDKATLKRYIWDSEGVYRCPVCNHVLVPYPNYDGISDTYCYNCGQAIDWSDD